MYIVGLVILYSTLSYLLFDKISRDDHMHPDQDDHTASMSTSIEELPVISFPDRELAESSTCVICLEIFQHEERCRVFPVCKHCFMPTALIFGWRNDSLAQFVAPHAKLK
ncbi:hypothetical protein RHMOL_Rhmol07G0303000 [Rhododendron molle]|uniref:Uncharacterized protein n=1 Tax=Rhododendron molle TaxID=49168 RepID=A0ACC0N6U3_RHOML|nr:hypothetical protein RHMOL_Rhmol07G0303000 [Rhododendron molle]